VPGLTFFGVPATAVVVLQILIIAVAFSFVAHLFNTIIMALGQQKRLLMASFWITVLNAILNAFLIPHYSYLAAAFITILCEILVIIMPVRVIRAEGIALPGLGRIPRIIVAMIITAVVGIWVQDIPVILALIFTAATYVVSLYLLGGLPKELLQELRPRRGGGEVHA